MNSSRLRRLVATAAASVAAAVALSTFAAGPASATTGDELASRIVADHLPYSQFSLAPDGNSNATLSYWTGDPTPNPLLTWKYYMPTDPADWSHPDSRFFLVPDGTMTAYTVSRASNGSITGAYGQVYTTFRIMNFHATVNGNQVDLSNPLCLDASGGLGTPEALLATYGCDAGSDHQANQLWIRVADPSNPNVYSLINVDGLNRTMFGDINTAPRLSIPNIWSHPDAVVNATLQSPKPAGDFVQRFTETDHAGTFTT